MASQKVSATLRQPTTPVDVRGIVEHYLAHRKPWSPGRARALSIAAVLACTGTPMKHALRWKAMDLLQLRLPSWAWRAVRRWLVIRTRLGLARRAPDAPLWCTYRPHEQPQPWRESNCKARMLATLGPNATASAIRSAAPAAPRGRAAPQEVAELVAVDLAATAA